MSERIYVDANIYLDYCEGRADSIRPLQELAFSVFQRTLECEFEIVVSNLVIEEVKTALKTKVTLDMLIADLTSKNKIVYVEETSSEIAQAKRRRNWRDALHAIIANRTKCKCIVTRNISDFLEFSDILEAKLPEHL